MLLYNNDDLFFFKKKRDIVLKAVDFEIDKIETLKEGDVILGKIKHINILKCFGFIDEGLLTFMICEYCEVKIK